MFVIGVPQGYIQAFLQLAKTFLPGREFPHLHGTDIVQSMCQNLLIPQLFGKGNGFLSPGDTLGRQARQHLQLRHIAECPCLRRGRRLAVQYPDGLFRIAIRLSAIAVKPPQPGEKSQAVPDPLLVIPLPPYLQRTALVNDRLTYPVGQITFICIRLIELQQHILVAALVIFYRGIIQLCRLPVSPHGRSLPGRLRRITHYQLIFITIFCMMDDPLYLLVPLKAFKEEVQYLFIQSHPQQRRQRRLDRPPVQLVFEKDHPILQKQYLQVYTILDGLDIGRVHLFHVPDLQPRWKYRQYLPHLPDPVLQPMVYGQHGILDIIRHPRAVAC